MIYDNAKEEAPRKKNQHRTSVIIKFLFSIGMIQYFAQAT
jgi:hypothetical protein